VRKLNYLTVDWSLDYAQHFPSIQPTLVEIGFGNAEYLIHLAKTRPDHNIIGLEISSQSMTRAERKIEARQFTHVRPIHSTAETALAHFLEPESVQEFHINYPDPWFKKKHSRRRLIKRETVDMLTSRLVIGGKLLLGTDIVAYAEMAHEVLSDTDGLTNMLDAPWVDDLEGRFRTKYEMRGYREGRPGHFFIYQRNETPVIHKPVIKELEMPHLFLHSPLNAEEVVSQFAQTRTESNGVHIGILHAYNNVKNNSAIFEVVVEEPTIDQHTVLLMNPRETEHEYIIKMSTIGHTRPTYGMHRAVQAVGDWVTSLHDDAQITAMKLRD
jgi:tRNA (guanine-N7-)-methyltransferase